MVCTFRFCVKIVPPILGIFSMCLCSCAVSWEIVPPDILKCYPQNPIYFPGKSLSSKVQFLTMISWKWLFSMQKIYAGWWLVWHRLSEFYQIFSYYRALLRWMPWAGGKSSLCNHPSVVQEIGKKAQSALEWARRYFPVKNISREMWRSHHCFCKNASHPVRTPLILTLPKTFPLSSCWKVEMNESEE